MTVQAGKDVVGMQTCTVLLEINMVIGNFSGNYEFIYPNAQIYQSWSYTKRMLHQTTTTTMFNNKKIVYLKTENE